jgi:tRNA threonylcarbamoyladenosine biosynthesis protein TsaB
MRILAIDTSTSVAAVAVLDDSGLLGEYLLDHGKTHSQKLVPLIKDLMDSLELSLADIDVFAVSNGPGSFTGLRIGITTIKAMAYAAKKPVLGIPTLDALAYNVPLAVDLPLAVDALICPIMDARNNQVYTAIYENDKGVLNNITGYLGLPVSELAAILNEKNRYVVFTGDAVALHRDYLKEEIGERCSFAPLCYLKQRASSVAQIAYIKAAGGELENCYDVEPFYLRKSQAEREYDRKQGEITREDKV